jgi:formate C-acetyltransferase
MDQEFLAEIEEWAALGFYEGLDLPFPRSYGLALRRLYEHMPVRVPAEPLLIPCEPLFEARNMTTHGVHHALGYICNLFHHCGLEVVPSIAEEKKQRFPQHADAIDALVADLRARLPHFGGYTHSNPDIRRVVHEGFDAMDAELDGEIGALRGTNDDEEGLNLLLALKDYAAGVRALHGTTLGALRTAAGQATGRRREELSLIADSFAACFLRPCTTFLQGLLAVNFTWMLDGCDSIGRVDQTLGWLFEQDIESGELDIAFARRLIDEWWQSFESMNGWNLQVGGRRIEDGRDGCNALTRELILACGRNKLRRPNLAFRVTADTPDNLVRTALEVLREGSGRPALYNDDLYIRTLLDLDLGVTEADAREVSFGGCTETMLGGISNVGSLEGDINLANALELALHDGVDPDSGTRVGPATGAFADFPDFDAFLGAVREQIGAMTDGFAERANAALKRRFAEGDPKLYRTFFTRDCVKNHRSFEAGGARYNWSVVSYQGIGNLIDSLAAVKRCVFDTGAVDAAQLVDALDADFAGYTDVQRLLRAAPAFGNDNPEVDRLGADIIGFAWDRLLSHRQVRGGRFLPSCIVFATYARAGASIGATPDGRNAGAALNDSVGAVAGRDREGPTALLNSVLALPLSRAAGTPVLNLRFQKETLSTEDGLSGVAHLVRSFFARGGMQAQVSVISREDMLAAQQDPDEYGDLIVRIGGYSEYFVRLAKTLQDTVIARTEYGRV